MSKVIAAITTSVDGHVAGAPGRGLGIGGERLHYLGVRRAVSYEEGPRCEPIGQDKAWLDEGAAGSGLVVIGIGGHRPIDVRGRRPLGRKQSVGRSDLHRHAQTQGGT